MLTFNYVPPYFWGKVVLTKFISGCRMVWDLISGTSWFFKSKTEKVIGGGKSAILPNWCCLLFIIVLFTQPCQTWIFLTFYIKSYDLQKLRYSFSTNYHNFSTNQIVLTNTWQVFRQLKRHGLLVFGCWIGWTCSVFIKVIVKWNSYFVVRSRERLDMKIA